MHPFHQMSRNDILDIWWKEHHSSFPRLLLKKWISSNMAALHNGRTPVFDRRTFPVQCSTCSWWV